MRIISLAFSLTLPLCLLPLTAALGHGAYHNRLAEIARELESRPSDPALFRQRALLHVSHEDWQAALVDLEQVDRLTSDQIDTSWLRAQALDIGGQPAAAKGVLDVFLKRYPDHAGALATRARVLVKLAEPEAALTDYRTALSKSPHAEPELVQEVVETLTTQKLHEEAASLLETNLRRLGNSPGLVMKALELELMLGRYDDALARVEELQKSAPRPEPWMARRASVLAQAGRFSESIAAWQALHTHTQSLPNLERGAHAMQLIAEQAQQAVASLKSLSSTTPPKP